MCILIKNTMKMLLENNHKVVHRDVMHLKEAKKETPVSRLFPAHPITFMKEAAICVDVQNYTICM